MKDKDLSFYAGIGSRDTPKWTISPIREIVKYLAVNKNMWVRSGGAVGADYSFEHASKLVSIEMRIENKMQIFLPFPTLNDVRHDGVNYIYDLHDELFEVAKDFHPRYNKLKQPAKNMMARNGQQVLGRDLDDPSKFIVCYTENGEVKGGTGQALRIAEYYRIPVFNLGNYESHQDRPEYILARFQEFLNQLDKPSDFLF